MCDFVIFKVKMNTIKLTHEKLSVDEASQIVTSPKCGAVSMFIGTTRDNFENKKVVLLNFILDNLYMTCGLSRSCSLSMRPTTQWLKK